MIQIGDCWSITCDAVSRACRRLPLLTHLELLNARMLTDEIWNDIGNHLTCLTELSVLGSHHITYHGITHC